MRIEELVKEVNKLGLADSFAESANATPKSESCDKWQSMPCTDIPDFIERLPERIVDKNTGTEINISQSFIKKFIDVIDGELCPRRFWATKTTEADEESGKAAKMGNRFQWLGFGLLDYFGNIPDPITTEKTKKIGVDENRIRSNTNDAQKTLERLGYKITSKHDNMSFKCMSGELDLDCIKDGAKLITDIKYSGLIGDKWNRWAWPASKDEEFRFSHIVQAKQYLLLAELLGWDRDGFSFLVFDNRAGKEGQYREYVIKVSKAGMNQHKHLVLHIIEELVSWMDGDRFRPIPSCEGCKGCPISSTCEHFRSHPETIDINL